MDKRQGGFVGAAVIILVLLVLAVFVIGSIIRATSNKVVPATPVSNSQEAGSEPLRGFGMTPQPGGSFKDVFNNLPQRNRAVSWTGDWEELANKNSAPYVLAKSAKQHNFTPVVHVHTHTDAGRYDRVKLLRPLDAATKAKYKASAVEFSKTHKPRYFGIGVEVNRIYLSSPGEFDQFVSLFNDTAQAIHGVSPDTQVFASFQLEVLRGLRGGLYGDQNNEQVNNWDLLDQLAEADLIAFTTYPGIVFKDPGEIPNDYYTSATAKTEKPVVFSEVGWPSRIEAAGWQNSPNEQKRFIERFNELTVAIKPPFSIWSFLYDLPLPDPFKGIGLLETDNTPRPAYEAWAQQD